MARKAPDFHRLEQFMQEMELLFKSKKLLDDIYAELGGYGGTISKELLMKLNDFYGFDDSE